MANPNDPLGNPETIESICREVIKYGIALQNHPINVILTLATIIRDIPINKCEQFLWDIRGEIPFFIPLSFNHKEINNVSK